MKSPTQWGHVEPWRGAFGWKLFIVEGEAERVRTIFQRYLDLADE
jgi:hypothetical protein